MTFKTTTFHILKHLLVIMLFIAYELPIYLLKGGNQNWSMVLGFYLLLIAMFYFFRYVTLPFLQGKNWILKWLVILPLNLLVYCVLFVGLGVGFQMWLMRLPRPDINFGNVFLSLWRSSYVMGLAYVFFYQHQSLKREKEAARLEQALLIAQLNPHLLFNTISFAHSSVQESSPRAADALLLLSDLMRESLSQAKQGNMVSIDEEVQQVKRLLRLSQLLHNDNLQIAFDCQISGNYHNILVPAQLLLTVVENITKHGRLDDPARPAHIQLYADEHSIRLRSSNLVRPRPVSRGTSIGMDNLKRRLEIAYPNRHSVLQHLDQHHYKLDINIKL